MCFYGFFLLVLSLKQTNKQKTPNSLTPQCLSPSDGDFRFLPKYVSRNCFHVQTRQEHVVNDCDADVTILLGLGSCMVDLANWIRGGQPSCLAARFHVCSLGREVWGGAGGNFRAGAWTAGHPFHRALNPICIPLCIPESSSAPQRKAAAHDRWASASHGVISHSVKVTMSFLIFHLQTWGLFLGWESASLPRERVSRTCRYGCQPWLLRSFLPICMPTRVASGVQEMFCVLVCVVFTWVYLCVYRNWALVRIWENQNPMRCCGNIKWPLENSLAFC